MEIIDALFNRRSCRKYSPRPVEKEKIQTILQCANLAPSPANKQPWEFIICTNPQYQQDLHLAVESTKIKLAQRSGWKWLTPYSVDFLREAPVLIVVTGDPERNGAEQFLDEPGKGYEHACCAAIENILLAAQGLGLGALWFSLFEKEDARRIFRIDAKLDPVAIVCLGYTDSSSIAPVRKDLSAKVKYLE